MKTRQQQARRFFLKYTGFNIATPTPEQLRAISALARAEAVLDLLIDSEQVRIEWEDFAIRGSIANGIEWTCSIIDIYPVAPMVTDVLASRTCITATPDREHQRVIRAELALICYSHLVNLLQPEQQP